MDTALKSPGSDAVIFGPENESAARPGTANTMAADERMNKDSLIVPKKDEEKPKDTPKIVPASKPKKKAPVVSKMNQYALYDKNHPLNKQFPAIQNFKGPKRSPNCLPR
jgi:hypothetical protein